MQADRQAKTFILKPDAWKELTRYIVCLKSFGNSKFYDISHRKPKYKIEELQKNKLS